MPDTTNWTCSTRLQNGIPIASLTVSTNGDVKPIKLKGVCFSPCPINGSNAYGPAVGDWYWDTRSGDGYKITNWGALWARDLPNIRLLGANSVRVYCMLSRQLNNDGTFPVPWNSGPLQTHTEFLDQCWNGGKDPIYVLLGLPMPQQMYWKDLYDKIAPSQIEFWLNVVNETVQQVAAHPAVMGFTIQNELDGSTVTYGPDKASVDFWWGQVAKLSALAKTAMGTNKKLVGMAVHDDPNIAGKAASHMANCPSMDFWGVNSYQTQNFDSVFGPVPNVGPGYNGLTGAALKPVILTEWGIPATSHSNPNDHSTIYADNATIGRAAKVVTAVAPQAFTQPLSLGLYYFEYSDEWWNQPGSPNIWTWWGGNPASGFPNGYWDQEGFGLFSVVRGQGLQNNSPIWVQNGGYGGPNTPVDALKVRDGTFIALKESWPKVVSDRKDKVLN